MTPFEIIFASIGGTAALVAILGFLAKSLVTNLLNKDIEKYKVTLVAEKDAKLTELRHEFEKLSNEHRVRFERLHDRRDEIIADLYCKLVEFHRGVDRFVDDALLLEGAELEREKKELWRVVDDFRDYAEKHRIYFSEQLCEQLDKLYETADKPTSLLMQTAESEGKENLVIAWQEAKNVLSGNVTEIRGVIEKEFRELLGVFN
jgi:deoxyribodipyrimidine photolyase